MLKYLLIVTLLNVKIISGDENDDEFVNSLPEEKKREFLRKVEERIENEVRQPKVPQGNATNIDQFEQRLQDQGKLVKEIVRTEINNLKRRNQPLEKSNNDNNEYDSHIDLTLRSQQNEESVITDTTEGKRKPRNDDMNGTKSETQIPVAVMYDENSSKGKRDVKYMPSDVYDNAKLAGDQSKVEENAWESTSIATKNVNVYRVARRSGDSDGISDDNKKSANHDINVSAVAVDTSTKSVEVTPYDNVNSTLQETVKPDFSTQPNGENSTVDDATATNYTFNNDDIISQGNIAGKMGVIGSTTLRYGNASQNIISTVNYEYPKFNTEGSLTEGVHVTSSYITTQYNATSKTIVTDSTNDADRITEPNDSVRTILQNNRETPGTTVNVYSYATTTHYQTTLQTDDIEYSREPNKSTSDSPSNGDNENQPLFVPVHSYNPENAYFNTLNNQGPNGNADKEIISRNTSTIFKKIENRSKSNTVDIHSIFVSSTNKTDLRIEDNKGNGKFESTASNTEIEINADDIMSSVEIRHMFDNKTEPVNIQSSGVDFPNEKPLKHNLQKIREILFKHNISFDELKDDRSVSDISPKVEVGYGFPQRNRVIRPTAQFNTFGTLLKKLVDHSNDSPHFVSKNIVDKTVIESDIDVYNDVIRSLKKHNEKLQNTVLYQTIKTLEDLKQRMKKKQLRNTIDKPELERNQTRFKIKDRDNRKPTPNSLEEDISNLGSYTTYDKATNKNASKNKTNTLKIHDKYLRLHANILRELVERNDVGLENYDWLTTTVDIQAAIAKLQDIIKKKKHHKILHHLDHRLLKLVTNLYKTAVITVIERQNLDSAIEKYFHHKMKPRRGKKNGKKYGGKRNQYIDIEVFGWTLDCLKNCLNGLHTAIKQISLITTYKNQHWFQNLKQLYLKSATDKEYLEILLHLVSARLFGLLEETAKIIFGEDGDFLKKNRAEFDRIGVEFVMLIKICNGLLGLNG